MHPNIHQRQHHHRNHFMEEEEEEQGGCSSVFSISNPFEQQHLVPITHQLFQQSHHLQAFLEQQNQRPPTQEQEHGHDPPPFFHVNFRLGLNENSVTHEGPQSGSFIHENVHAPVNLSHSLEMPQCWNLQEDSSTKEPIWEPLKRCQSQQSSESREEKTEKSKCKDTKTLQRDHRCRLFGGLEEIYALAKVSEANQAASWSALTGENSPTNAGITLFGDSQGENMNTNAGVANAATRADHGSETSTGVEEPSLGRKKEKKKKEIKEELSGMIEFLESLVRKVMDHQEILHSNFLEVIERLDEKRRKKEEAWRRQEVAKHNKEVIARAHEQALASNREALIVSYLEKITGQSISLPARPPLLLKTETRVEHTGGMKSVSADTNVRWPSAEIEALIQVRSSLDLKFHEPGSRGPLWEEVSSLMACMGYRRSARRCKEKWENINKYFRRTKETGKKRSQQSRTCAYFDQLDQLYSRTPEVSPPPIRPSINNESETRKVDDSDFLEAMVSERELVVSRINSCSSYKDTEIGSPRLDSDAAVSEHLEQGSNAESGKRHEDDIEKND